MKPRALGAKGGFTLAEVAVTILIFGIGTLLVLQGLNATKHAAAQTHNQKVARELAVLTLGRIESGLYWEDLDGQSDTLFGTYADEGYEHFRWEVVFGQDNFPNDYNEQGEKGYFDNLAYRREQEEEAELDDDEDEDEEVAEPFEKVRIKVVFPKLGEAEPEFMIERWIPWSLVYGQDEEEEEEGDGASGSNQ